MLYDCGGAGAGAALFTQYVQRLSDLTVCTHSQVMAMLVVACCGWLLSVAPMTLGMAGVLSGGAVLVVLFAACGVCGTGRTAWIAHACGLLSLLALVALLVTMAEWPTSALADATTSASIEWQWDRADIEARASVEDSLQCCGYASPEDRYVVVCCEFVACALHGVPLRPHIAGCTWLCSARATAPVGAPGALLRRPPPPPLRHLVALATQRR